GDFQPFSYATVAPARAALEARRNNSGAFNRCAYASNSGFGPFQSRSWIESKTGTSRLKVASVRKSNASFHAADKDSAKGRARRMEGFQCFQSCGMSPRCGYWEKTRAAAFAPQPT